MHIDDKPAASGDKPLEHEQPGRMSRLRKRWRVHMYRYTGRTCAIAGLALAAIPISTSIAAGDVPAWRWPALYVGSWIACWFGIRQAREAAINSAAIRENRRKKEKIDRESKSLVRDIKKELNVSGMADDEVEYLIDHIACMSDDEALSYIVEINRRYNE